MPDLRIRTALTISHENLETGRNLMANRRNTRRSELLRISGTCSCSCKGRKQKSSSSFGIRGRGPSVVKHCRKPSPSLTKGNLLLVIHIQEELKRKLNDLRPLFSRNKERYVSREVTNNVLASEGQTCRPEKQETKPTENQYACREQAAKSHLLDQN